MSETKRDISFPITIFLLVLVLAVSYFVSSFYINEVHDSIEKEMNHTLEDKIQSKKAQSEESAYRLIALFEHQKREAIPIIKKELYTKVALARQVALNIYEKAPRHERKRVTQKKIKETLSKMFYENEQNFIFITDYNANSILRGSHLNMKNIAEYRDADYRSIVLEEIQKVCRRGSGYIESRRSDTEEKELIYVEDLGIYQWYIGSSRVLDTQIEKIKKNLHQMIVSMPISQDSFFSLIQGDVKLYGTNLFDLPRDQKTQGWHKSEAQELLYYVKYYKDFDWYLVYGFKTSAMSEKIQKRFEHIENMVEKEFNFILRVSISLLVFTLLVSFLLVLKKDN
jgi:hypothetical protein